MKLSTIIITTLVGIALGVVLGLLSFAHAEESTDIYCMLTGEKVWQIVEYDEKGRKTVLLEGDAAYKQCVIMTLSDDKAKGVSL